MDKRFLAFLAAIAIIFTGIFILTNDKKAGAPEGSATVTNHVTGEGKSGVTLTEYGDFQCPACAQYYPVLKQVKQKYAEEIVFQFRNFPLFQLHPNAIASSRAAEAADLQGKFWEMHDMLYEGQNEWGPSSNPQAIFEKYAKALKLNTAKFTTDYKSTLVNDRVQADLAEGNRLKVSSTPTLFINGKKISNPDPTLEAFSKIIDTAIAQNEKDAEAEPSTEEPPVETTPMPAETTPQQ